MDYAKMSLTEVTKLPGASDIEPLMAKAKFARALQAESREDYAEAEKLLEEAIAAVR